MIKNIIFDVGNVLMSYNPTEYMKRLGFDKETRAQVNAAMFEHPLWNETDRGLLSSEELLNGFISHAPKWAEPIQKAYEQMGDCVHLMEHAVPWVCGLKEQGYRLYVLSNYSQEMYRQTEEKMDFLPFMDGTVFSYRCKMIKPEDGIYRYLCEKYDLKPEECIFIDDRKENIEGAERAGICGIRFAEYEQAEKELKKVLEFV